MKKSLFATLILGALYLTMPSFSTINGKPAPNKASKHKLIKFDCGSVGAVSGTVSTFSFSGSWAAVPGITSYNYGGYFNSGTAPSYQTIPTVNTTATNFTISIPSNVYGGRIGVVGVCGDRNVTGQTHGFYFENGAIVSYF